MNDAHKANSAAGLPPSLARPLVAADAIDPAACTLVDCRFRLDDPTAGEAAWQAERLAGSLYAHLDRDLSERIVPGRTGRHPLPGAATMRTRFAALGIDGARPVLFLDDAGGPYAARAWWLACQAGHPDARVVDGGLAACIAAGLKLDRAPAPATAAPAAPWPERPPLLSAVTAADVEALIARRDPETVLVDARARPRFEGDVEPLDPVAGHIPGALCAPFDANLGAEVDGQRRFLSAEALHARWSPLLGAAPSLAVCYCGSGVTAAHNVLAIVAAGLPAPRLYGGSWSEWVTDPSRPVATGPEASERT